MQLDDQVQTTFERCVYAQTILIERASIKTNEDRPRATGNIGLLGCSRGNAHLQQGFAGRGNRGVYIIRI